MCVCVSMLAVCVSIFLLPPKCLQESGLGQTQPETSNSTQAAHVGGGSPNHLNSICHLSVIVTGVSHGRENAQFSLETMDTTGIILKMPRGKTEPRNPCLGETSLSNVKEKSSHSQKNKTQTFVGLPIRKPKMSHSSGNERLGDINVNPHKEIKKPN